MINTYLEITNMNDAEAVMHDYRIPYVHCEKIVAGHVKTVLGNCDTERRTKIKNNAYIEKSSTSKNIQGNKSYREACKAYDDMIAHLNTGNQNKDDLEDTAACYGLLVLSPRSLHPEDELPFFWEALNIITEQCANVVQWYIHHDERLVHMHCFVVSDCEINTERLDNAVQMAALEKFGVPFMNDIQSRNS